MGREREYCIASRNQREGCDTVWGGVNEFIGEKVSIVGSKEEKAAYAERIFILQGKLLKEEVGRV
jgi:hypothetical protein